MTVAGRVALVTGSGSGIGTAIVTALARQGARVVVNDVVAERAQEVAGQLRSAGCDAVAMPCDVTDRAQVQAVVDAIQAQHGRLDILVNNVGIVRDRLLVDMPEEDWDLVLRTNLKSYFLCSQAAARLMIAQKYGRIVNISSRAWQGAIGQANYSASKGGIVSLTRSLALELGRHQITVNSIAPGMIDTPLIRALRQDVQERLLKMQPTGKMGRPEDIAFAAVFFASDEAEFITGQTLFVCGGKSVAGMMA